MIAVHCPHERLPLSAIRPKLNPKNRNTHPDAQIDAIVAQFKYQGIRHPIIMSKRSGLVVAGEGRFLAAERLKLSDFPVAFQDFADEAQEYAFGIADTAIADWASLDRKGIEGDLAALGTDFDLALLGIEDFELTPIDDPDAENETPEPPAEPKSQLGDLFLLGSHRLLCGDSTNIEHVKYLMGGTQANMTWTDPPYNVDYTGGTGLKIENDKMGDEQFREFLTKAFTCMAESVVEGGAMYIAHADSEGYNFRGAARDSGWLIKQCLIWVKSSLVMGRQDYQWKHEPILYGWKDGGPHSWYSDRSQTTVLEFDKPHRNAEHPTMKPVELIEYCIRNSSKANDRVLDLFGGSGSTMIACEKLKRQSFLMELSPQYVDVILDRWEKFSGKQAKREDGKMWQEVKNG